MPPKKKKRPLKYYNILLHRYLGYFFAGTTVIYAVSGLAVNHIEDWNPNYSITHTSGQIPPLKDPENISATEARSLFTQFGIEKDFQPDNVFYPDDQNLEILINSHEKITLNVTTGTADFEKTSRRPVLHLFNFLHLNSGKKLWTLYADVYAVALLLLALTGLFMKKGKKGLWGEAGIWTVAGMVLPVFLIWLYYSWV